MGGIRKRGRVWYSDILIAGKRVRVPLSPDKVVAQEKLRELEQDKDHSRYGVASGTIAWKEYLPKYLKYSAGSKEPESARQDRAAINALERFKTPRLLTDVTPEFLEQWKGHRKTEKKGPATINRQLHAIKALMNKAVEWGYLRKWSGASVKDLKETRKRLLFYTPDELKALLRKCGEEYYGLYDWTTICLLGAQAGLRRSEIYWLSWDDLKTGVIQITPKDGWQPKTGEIRFVPISKTIGKRLTSIKRSGPWVIGERPSLGVLSSFFGKICRRAGLKGGMHTLRHTFCSHLVQNGVDLYVVAELAGHTNIEQTKMYAHLKPENLERAISRLPAL